MDTILNAYFKSASSWLKDDGTFNKTHLITDSVAGTVLGTVGGVVTSRIVKKNQLESGLQDLKCTIAGQDVASFGDEFVVGIEQ